MGDTEEFLYPGGTHRVLLGFNPLPFSSILLNPEGNRSKTRKGIQFLIEWLIINSVLGRLGFTVTDFQQSQIRTSPAASPAFLWESFLFSSLQVIMAESVGHLSKLALEYRRQ